MLVRFLLCSLVTLVSWVVLVCGHFPARALGPQRLAAWRSFCTRHWGRAMARVVGMRIRVEGAPGRGFLVANHLSYMDIIVLGAVTGSGFVSKAEVAGWPGLGIAARSAGTLFPDREQVNTNMPLYDLVRTPISKTVVEKSS